MVVLVSSILIPRLNELKKKKKFKLFPKFQIRELRAVQCLRLPCVHCTGSIPGHQNKKWHAEWLLPKLY